MKHNAVELLETRTLLNVAFELQQLPTGQHPDYITSADLNGDGKQDLITVDQLGPPNVAILLSNGNGTFTAAQTYAVGTDPRSVAVADLNNDGILDLAVANESTSTVSVLL